MEFNSSSPGFCFYLLETYHQKIWFQTTAEKWIYANTEEDQWIIFLTYIPIQQNIITNSLICLGDRDITIQKTRIFYHRLFRRKYLRVVSSRFIPMERN